MEHPVVWFEVMGKNGEKLQSFYQSLFGWKIDASSPTKYGMVEAVKGRGIPGGVGELGETPWPSKVTFYVSTESIVDSLEQAKKLGGKVLMPRTELPGATLGFFADPEGNAIGLVEENGA